MVNQLKRPKIGIINLNRLTYRLVRMEKEYLDLLSYIFRLIDIQKIIISTLQMPAY